ncbi:hypothetical protein RM550_07155 [Streptomyces sp. DSM 41527]|uniref:Secreted protein n=1 Tax=Streptomyces mooreae TaxID=3075523 RepID=A0ABU2T2R3_9ACTN|nr:hypothetical protein [Streptomyces sp. DSM 41527]MDT0455516.1 hypothetical protein [Streptomyces sp. DSM 41527]
MKFRIGRILVGATALASAALAMTAGSASAAGWDHIFGPNVEGSSGVRVYVQEHGDVVKLCDTKADGYSAQLEVYEDGYSNASYYMTVTTGAGTCKTHRASDGAKYNLDENNGVSFGFYGKGPESSANWENND